MQLGDFGFESSPVAPGQLDESWLDAVADVARSAGVWWRVLDGNHDAQPLVRDRYPSLPDGIRPLRDGVLDWADRGSVWTWLDTRFAAMGGAASVDIPARQPGIDWFVDELISVDDIAALERRLDGQHADVLITHDTPGLPPGMPPITDDPEMAATGEANWQRVLTIVDLCRAPLMFHGHLHRRVPRRLERDWGTVQVEGLASGAEENPLEASTWLLELA